MAKIVFVGGGSYNWMPSMLGRLFQTPTCREDRVILMDLDADALEDLHGLALKLKTEQRSPIEIGATTDLAAALDGADYVCLIITVGGMEAMRADVEIPEAYGIWQTVGDTVGPGGLCRALRNVPVVVDLARRMERYCPGAWLLNLTNPLSTLTRAVTRETRIRAAGLCQGVVEHVEYLTRLLGEEPGRDVQFVTAGIDHCPWLLRFKVRGRDGRELLRERGLCSADLKETDVAPSADGHLNVKVGTRAGFALWRELGVLPGIGDRHLVEFFGTFLTSPEAMERYGIVRTRVDDRIARRENARARVREMAAGRRELAVGATHAPVIQMVDALEGRGDLLTTLNVENAGQIAELPARANVETLCRVDRLGVHPQVVGEPLPRQLEAVIRPHVLRQEGSIDAALSGDFEYAVRLLATDPLIRKPGDARAMLEKMVEATKPWLPQFK
ncbi:MAG: hypothetical protein M5U26_00490 [Planctomycetota bacterium]|nr:hypothetical protein [Planctomycetota bacterium]